jgi:hypothetical protein
MEVSGQFHTPAPFTHRDRAPSTHWIGGWVGPRAVLDTAVKRKIPSPRRESNPRTPIVQSVAERYTDWAIMALRNFIRTEIIGLNTSTELKTADFQHYVQKQWYSAGLRAGWPGFESRQGLGIFPFTTASRPALGPTQHTIQWVPEAPSLGVKRPVREADHSHPVPKSKSAWSCTCTPTIGLDGVVLS